MMSAQVNPPMERGAMVTLRLDELLKEKDKSAYWLAGVTGMAYSTLSNLRNCKTKGIDFETIDKLCRALECEPGELFARSAEKSKGSKKVK